MAEETKPIDEVEVDATAEEQVVPETNQARMLANLRAKYGEDLEDDELYGRAMEGYDADHDYAKAQREETGRLAEIMQENPDLAAMYAEMFERGKDGNPEMALINIAPLLKSYLTGEITSDEYEAKKKEQKAADDASAKKKADDEAKMAAQEKVFTEVCEEMGIDPQETLGKLSEVLLNPMASYEVGKEQIRALINMLNYEQDVEAARVQGRNEQIETRKRDFARKNDGLPSGGSAVQAPQRAPSELERIGSRRAAANQL